MSDQAELIPIAEAAARLGIHKNTVHAHVKAGWHRWEWMPGPKGKQIGIVAADLHNTGPIQASTSVHMDPSISVDASRTVHMDPSGRMDASPAKELATDPLAMPETIAGYRTADFKTFAEYVSGLANQASGPYLDRLASVSEENGRLKEQVRQLEARLLESQAPPASALPADMSPSPERPPWWRRFLGLD